MKILIATPCYGGQVTMNYLVSMIELFDRCKSDNFQIGTHFIGNESLITRARNSCAAEFLKSEYRWDKLFFIDADISWKYSQALALIKSDKSIIGGAYSVKRLPLSLNFKPLKQHAGYFRTLDKTMDEFAHYVEQENNDENEIPVEYLATGFMCIDRSVFESFSKDASRYSYPCLTTGKIVEHWDFFRCGTNNGAYLSEDFFFCSQAVKYGFQPYLNPTCLVNHEGQYVFRP
jgi:hypothetical protein